MIKDTITLKGTYDILVKDKDGNVKYDLQALNAVVTVGKGLITSRLGQSSDAVAAYIAVGTSNTAVSAAQTALIGEISTNGLTRALGTFTRQTTTTTNDTFQLTKTFTLSGSSTVEEIGVFNASSSGTMLSRALTGTITLVNGDQLITTYKLSFA